MNRLFLLLDCNYLCHRAWYSFGNDLSFRGKSTSVIYGFLKSISHFQELFNTPCVAFCWDSKASKREEIFPAYKSNRKDKYKDMDEDTIKLEKEFRWQMKMLRRKYLPAIGYKNIFTQKGYEADDIIASISFNLPMLDEAIIVSSDQDLYQLISPCVSLYNPVKGKILTPQGFKKKYGILPHEWKTVKVIAGCTTDGVPGIKGIGEKTAIKYLMGDLKRESKAYQAITSINTIHILKRNLKLVDLPFKGTKVPKLQKDEITQKGWNKVIKLLGMKSLRDKAPIFKRRRKNEVNQAIN